MKYKDLWDSHKATSDFDNTLASLYEQHTMGNDGDSEDEVTPADLLLLKNHLEDMLGVVEEIESETATIDDPDQADIRKAEESLNRLKEEFKKTPGAPFSALDRVWNPQPPDDCVRIALNIPAARLSAEQRVALEQAVVREAAIYSKMWMEALEYGGESLVMSDTQPSPEEDFDEELVEAEEEVAETPEHTIQDIAKKWHETYEQMRVDYSENFEELEIAVVECLIEDGYIMPGHHYDVETHISETYDGEKQAFVTGPAGSKIVKKEKKNG